jgi:acyl-CoA hydrolase
VPKLLSGALQPEVVVVRARPAGHGFVLAPSVGWAVAACRHARRVVVEADPSLPEIQAPAVPGKADLVVEAEIPSIRPASVAVDEVDRHIGQLVASIIPEGATVQYGPGSVAEATIAALERPVRVFSGMVTDSLVDLAGRGLLAASPAVAAYVHGGSALDELAAAGAVRVTGVEETHDLGAVAAIPGFVALNTAIQVGLDGAVNVEGVGDRPIAGVGGHPDYALAASLSPGGMSVVALRTVTASGVPTIVPQVDRISTGPTDVDVVVTELGIADLRGKDRFERREALLAIAGPP